MMHQLKGCPNARLSDEVDEMIAVLRLKDKRDVYTCKLSGGMRRKLSVGIALLADSKVILHDHWNLDLEQC